MEAGDLFIRKSRPLTGVGRLLRRWGSEQWWAEDIYGRQMLVRDDDLLPATEADIAERTERN